MGVVYQADSGDLHIPAATGDIHRAAINRNRRSAYTERCPSFDFHCSTLDGDSAAPDFHGQLSLHFQFGVAFDFLGFVFLCFGVRIAFIVELGTFSVIPEVAFPRLIVEVLDRKSVV